jgi:hypothetical protein
MSEVPPGAKGTMRRTGRSKFWAAAGWLANATPAIAARARPFAAIADRRGDDLNTDTDLDMISSGAVQAGPDQPGSERAGSLESCLVTWRIGQARCANELDWQWNDIFFGSRDSAKGLASLSTSPTLGDRRQKPRGLSWEGEAYLGRE